MQDVSVKAPAGCIFQRKPILIKAYNSYMGRVDKSNQLLSYYTGQQKKNFFIGASNIRAVLEYIWGADSENNSVFFASALVFEIRYTAHICLELVLCFC